MQTITTKFHGPTNSTGARISATSSYGKTRVYVSYPYDKSGIDCHIEALEKLCDKLNWKGKFVAGETPSGYIFVNTDGFNYEVTE